MPITPPPLEQVRLAIRAALAEDLGLGDVTTGALFSGPVAARAVVVAEERMVVAGVLLAEALFAELGFPVESVAAATDGAPVEDGQRILELEGDGRALLLGERVMLNFLQRLSGIATLTQQFCEAVRGYPCAILDTRKTTPGLRALEKWAVRLGGGQNHRSSLGDGVLIKDNHLALLRGLGRDLADACRLARERGPHGLRIGVEAETLSDVRHALEGKADIILLDNMSPGQVRQAVELIKGRALVEVSGGVTLETARAYAAAGAGFISVGALTHSAPAARLKLELSPLARRQRRPPRRRRHGRGRHR